MSILTLQDKLNPVGNSPLLVRPVDSVRSCSRVVIDACVSMRAQALLQVIPPVEHHPDTPESDRPQCRLRGALWEDD